MTSASLPDTKGAHDSHNGISAGTGGKNLLIRISWHTRIVSHSTCILIWRSHRDSNPTLTTSTVLLHPWCGSVNWRCPLDSNQPTRVCSALPRLSARTSNWSGVGDSDPCTFAWKASDPPWATPLISSCAELRLSPSSQPHVAQALCGCQADRSGSTGPS